VFIQRNCSQFDMNQCVLVVISVVLLACVAEVHVSNSPLSLLTFGSCCRSTLPQPFWEHIGNLRPDVFLWLGDIIYADLEPNGTWVTHAHHTMRDKYDHQKSIDGYQQHILQAQPPINVYGVWDDHDYGKNDAGSAYAQKDTSKLELMRFLDEPNESPRRNRHGAYVSYEFGSSEEGNLAKLIILDGRFFRDDINEFDHDSTFLGEQQWQWLEDEFNNSKAKIHLIATGVQFVSDDRDPFIQFMSKKKSRCEGWALFPQERQKMIDLIGRLKVPGVVFLSGDVHFAEISRLSCSNAGYHLYDLTSSSLTHSLESVTEKYGYRSGTTGMPLDKPSNLTTVNWILAKVLRKVAFWIAPRRHSLDIYARNNFGGVTIDWSHQSISLQVYNTESGKLEVNRQISFRELTFNEDYLQNCTAAHRKFASLKLYEIDQWVWKSRAILVVLSLVFVISVPPLIAMCLFCRRASSKNVKPNLKLE
jgi:alkaline phosphatase D